MEVRLEQKPVGQGNFWQGSIDARNQTINWVYDCGSTNIHALRREIETVRDVSQDLLFISHLDADHINGIDSLLNATSVKEVVLPYLSDDWKILLLADENENGQLTGQLIDFVKNPSEWLLQRGVERITFIRKGNGPSEPEPLPDPSYGLDGPITLKWSRSPAQLKGSRNSQIVDEGALAVLRDTTGNVLDWLFLPQVHQPTPARVKLFRAALRKEFPNQSVRKIIDAFRRPADRAKLRRCYDSIWKDHNKISLSLFAGPIAPTDDVWRGEFEQGNSFSSSRSTWSSGVGWLASGDADLGNSTRRSEFLAFYKRHLAAVGVLQLPHHGSSRNFHPTLMEHFPYLIIALAAAGVKNPYGHPHDYVRSAVNAHGNAEFVKVSERRKSKATLFLTGFVTGR